MLVEIHNEPDLKLNLKFEIEVLCNTLSIDLRSVVVGNCLKDPNLLVRIGEEFVLFYSIPFSLNLLHWKEKRLVPALLAHLQSHNFHSIYKL